MVTNGHNINLTENVWYNKHRSPGNIDSNRPQWMETMGEIALQWCHMNIMVFSNHWQFDCPVINLFRLTSKKTSNFCITGLWEGNPLVTGRFPSQRASNMERVSMSWSHHVIHYWVTIRHRIRHCIRKVLHDGHTINNTGLILGLRPANERRCYKVMPSLIGWAQT